MRTNNHIPKETIPAFDPNSSDINNNIGNNFSYSNNQNNQNFEQKKPKSFLSPIILITLVSVVGLGVLFTSLKNYGTQQYQEKCTQGVSSTGEKVMNCTTYSNGISTHTSFPYIFWLNSRAGNYSNNNGIYERVWSAKKTYTTSTSTSTNRSTLGSSGKSYGGSTS